ncbi:MAG TPA: SGNH/GDSL hydrolase family protein [Tepidisphaeraceae bacterium]|nr:SGNH/GDSL hydrolase family protein [Tepidisphaeraceae bacterium]
MARAPFFSAIVSLYLGLSLLLPALPCRAANVNEPETTDHPPVPGAKPLDPSFVPVTDDPKLPRVLIIGDSISIGYTIPVRQLLAGKANVHRPPANCGDTARGLKNLDRWLATDKTAANGGKWDVITFNFGLHDLKYLDANGKYVDPSKGKQVAPPPLYEKNLRELVVRLKATGAKLIWVNTTPVPAGTLGRIAGDEVPYNKVAAKVMAENGIPTVDLYSVAESDLEDYQRPRNVHFTPAGWHALAEAVAAGIEKSLATPATLPG